MKKLLVSMLAASTSLMFAGEHDGLKHVRAAGDVFHEIMDTPDKGIPHEILEKARCVGIIPGLKRAGFIVGAKYGKGIMVCRTDAGETDVVLVVQNRDGERKLLQDKFTLGADASVMGGPVGRTAAAETDAQLHAEILTWSRARGLFAGIAIEGSTLRPDSDDNHALYGREITQKEILHGDVPAPADTERLYAELNRFGVGDADRDRR
jgi:lipid-binding SYLF domain-containing protein